MSNLGSVCIRTQTVSNPIESAVSAILRVHVHGEIFSLCFGIAQFETERLTVVTCFVKSFRLREENTVVTSNKRLKSAKFSKNRQQK